METELVIFDNDGVLGDSEPLIKEAQVIAALAHGVTITPEWSFQHAHGLRPADVIDKIAAYGGMTINHAEFLTVFDKAFAQLIDAKLKATSGILEVLAALKRLGVAMCVATSSPLVESYRKIELIGADFYFNTSNIFSGEQVPRGKPFPDLMLLAAQEMGFKPQVCTVIEDAPSGVQAGKNAGMKVIGYTGGSHYRMTEMLSESHLYAAGADHVVTHHHHLLKAIP